MTAGRLLKRTKPDRLSAGRARPVPAGASPRIARPSTPQAPRWCPLKAHLCAGGALSRVYGALLPAPARFGCRRDSPAPVGSARSAQSARLRPPQAGARRRTPAPRPWRPRLAGVCPRSTLPAPVAAGGSVEPACGRRRRSAGLGRRLGRRRAVAAAGARRPGRLDLGPAGALVSALPSNPGAEPSFDGALLPLSALQRRQLVPKRHHHAGARRPGPLLPAARSAFAPARRAARLGRRRSAGSVSHLARSSAGAWRRTLFGLVGGAPAAKRWRASHLKGPPGGHVTARDLALQELRRSFNRPSGVGGAPASGREQAPPAALD